MDFPSEGVLWYTSPQKSEVLLGCSYWNTEAQIGNFAYAENFFSGSTQTKDNIAIMSAKIKWGIEACCFLAICVVQGEKEAGEEIHDWIVVSKRFGLSLPCLLKLKADRIRVGSTIKMIKTKSYI